MISLRKICRTTRGHWTMDGLRRRETKHDSQDRLMCSFLNRISWSVHWTESHHSRRIRKDFENKGIDRESSKDSYEEEVEESDSWCIWSLIPTSSILQAYLRSHLPTRWPFWISAWSKRAGSKGFHLEPWILIEDSNSSSASSAFPIAPDPSDIPLLLS